MKKMKKISLLVVLCVVLIFTSCGTLFTKGGSAYREGVSQYKSKEYVKSLDSLQTALIKNPEFLEASAMFPVVFNEGTQYYKSVISENAVKQTPDEADMVYFAYQNIQNLHQIAKNSQIKGLTTEDFASEIEESKANAAQIRFNYAESLEATGERENIKAAVAHYEIVKERDSQFPNIDQRIEQAVNEATVTLMLVGSRDNIDFHNQINTVIKESLANERFVTIINSEDYQGQTASAQDIFKWAEAHNIDYVLDLLETKSFKKIITEEKVLLPSSNPIFNGKKSSYGFSKKYQIDYNLINFATGDIIYNKVNADYTSPLFTYSFVKQDTAKKMNFENTGEFNYSYVSSNANPETLSMAISSLSSDYNHLYIPPTVTDPTSKTQWTNYFKSKYNDWNWSLFVNNEGGDNLFLGLELIFDTNNNLFYFIGDGPLDSIQKQKIYSSYLNSKVVTANNIIASEHKSFDEYLNYNAALQVGEFLKQYF